MSLEAMVNFLKTISLFSFIIISCISTHSFTTFKDVNYYPDSQKIFNIKLDDSICVNVGKNQLILKNDSYLYFYESGNILSGFLEKNQIVKIGCIDVLAEALGTETRDFCDIAFYENGNIQKIWATQELKLKFGDYEIYISSINNEKTLSPIQFSEDGFFQEGYLAKDFEYMGNTFPQYSYISFSKENPTKIILSKDTIIDNQNYKEGMVYVFK